MSVRELQPAATQARRVFAKTEIFSVLGEVLSDILRSFIQVSFSMPQLTLYCSGVRKTISFDVKATCQEIVSEWSRQCGLSPEDSRGLAIVFVEASFDSNSSLKVCLCFFQLIFGPEQLS